MVFDNKFIDELKMKNDIVDVIGKYVRLEQRGTNYWGKCPFHHEKTASFAVNSIGQYYKCFGCGKSGDVISFIRDIESLDFTDAVKFLAERAKMTLPEINIDDERVRENKKRRERVLDLLKDTAKFYVQNLHGDKADRHLDYIFKRKIASGTLLKFGIGASLSFDELPKFLKAKGYTEQEMLDSGAVDSAKGRLYDSLGERLIIPIINQFGQVVAFGGRLLEKKDFANYKNTKETIVFSKSNNLYNLNNLKKLKNEKGLDGIIIVEGYMDTISLVQAGIENVVASMGTSLTKDQARILKRYSDKVYISYDGDFAGQKASIRGLEILKDEGLDVKVVSLPDGLDPDDVINKFGAEGYKKLVLEAKPLIDFKLDILKKTYDLSNADGKRKFVSQAMRVIKESPSATEQEDLLMTVRDLTKINLETLKRDLYNLPDSEEPTAQSVIPATGDNVGDKVSIAARFILASYLFDKPFAAETNIENIEFFKPEHIALKEHIVGKKKAGEKIRFTDVYDLFGDEYSQEISRMAGLEIDDNKNFDQAVYFFDCVKTLKLDMLNREIERLTALFQQESDNDKRRTFASEMAKLLAEKNKLS
jgi:DNA primase